MSTPSSCLVASPTGTSRPAYTLAEMLVSVAAMGVLMVGISSAILLATQAIDDGENPSARIREASATADQFIQDASCALSFSEKTSTAVTFTVPDRDDDEQPETIRYVWSSAGGGSITRTYNGGSAIPIAEDVSVVLLQWEIEEVTVPGPAGPEVRYYATAVNFMIRVGTGTDLSTGVNAGVALLNRPEVPAP